VTTSSEASTLRIDPFLKTSNRFLEQIRRQAINRHRTLGDVPDVLLAPLRQATTGKVQLKQANRAADLEGWSREPSGPPLSFRHPPAIAGPAAVEAPCWASWGERRVAVVLDAVP
jgi:hypothetical protein